MESTPVDEIVPGVTGHSVLVKSDGKGEFRAKNLIVCAGPWTNKILAKLRLGR